MTMTFHGRGKLLLTGEYVVLDGAAALAVPTRFGQSLKVTAGESPGLRWQSLDRTGKPWLDLIWRPGEPPRTILGPEDAANRLIRILEIAMELRPQAVRDILGKSVSTHLEFDREWGLGTSSTLIHTLSEWLRVDSFQLLERSFGGSGYDLACAGAEGPIIYRTGKKGPKWEPVAVSPYWWTQTFFLYRGQKQDSREGIRRYREREASAAVIERISEITADLIKELRPVQVQKLIAEHEALIAATVGLPTVREELFPDFNGQLKSLGAWGGDFIWVVGPKSEAWYRDYFQKKGYPTLLSWTEMTGQGRPNT